MFLKMEKVSLMNFHLLLHMYILNLCIISAISVGDETLCNLCKCEESEVRCNRLLDIELLRSYSEGPVSSLVITNSCLKELSERDLVKFFSVTELHIHDSDLGDHDELFYSFTDIETIDLRNNSLTNISKNTFSIHEQLTSLDLSNNKIKIIQNYTFINLQNLCILLLSGNQIEELDEHAFAGLEKLFKLDLRGNRLDVLTGAVFSGAKWLDSLILSDNQLHTLNMSSGLEMLSNLDLSNNNIETLEKGCLQGLWTLHHLDLSNNSIKSLGNNFLYWLEALRTLNLSENRITDVSEFSFENVENLEVLDISGNLLKTLANNIFMDLSDLKFLDLSKNRLVSVSGTLLGPMESLEELRLERNELSAIDSDLAKQLSRPALKSSLRGNPFNCTCESLGAAYEIFANSSVSNASSVNVFCDGDENKPWSEVIPALKCFKVDDHVSDESTPYDVVIDIMENLSVPNLDWITHHSKDSEEDDRSSENSGDKINTGEGTVNSKDNRDFVTAPSNAEQDGKSNGLDDDRNQNSARNKVTLTENLGFSNNIHYFVLGFCSAILLVIVVVSVSLYLLRKFKDGYGDGDENMNLLYIKKTSSQ